MSTVTPTINLVKPATIEQFSLATFNNNLDLIDAEALSLRKESKGLLQSTVVATNSGSVTALTVISNIASFTFKAGRKYRIKWDFTYQGNTAGNYLTALIGTCLTTDAAGLTTGITQLNGRPFKVHDNGIDSSGYCEATYQPVADTTVQIKFLIQVTTGAGTARISGSALQPTLLNIYDDGLQF